MGSIADLRDPEPNPTYDRAEQVYFVRPHYYGGGKWEVSGPAFLHPSLVCDTEQEAKKLADILHRVYWHGRIAGSNERARQVLGALGIAPQYGDDMPLKFRPKDRP